MALFLIPSCYFCDATSSTIPCIPSLDKPDPFLVDSVLCFFNCGFGVAIGGRQSIWLLCCIKLSVRIEKFELCFQYKELKAIRMRDVANRRMANNCQAKLSKTSERPSTLVHPADSLYILYKCRRPSRAFFRIKQQSFSPTITSLHRFWSTGWKRSPQIYASDTPWLAHEPSSLALRSPFFRLFCLSNHPDKTSPTLP